MAFFKRDSQIPKPVQRKRIIMSVTIRKDLVEWIDHEVDMGVFRSRSHGAESLVRKGIEGLTSGRK